MGDPVNVAARLQETTKDYGVSILASDSVVRAAGEELLWREVARAKLRGRQEPLTLMRPMDCVASKGLKLETRAPSAQSA